MKDKHSFGGVGYPFLSTKLSSRKKMLIFFLYFPSFFFDKKNFLSFSKELIWVVTVKKVGGGDERGGFVPTQS